MDLNDIDGDLDPIIELITYAEPNRVNPIAKRMASAMRKGKPKGGSFANTKGKYHEWRKQSYQVKIFESKATR